LRHGKLSYIDFVCNDRPGGAENECVMKQGSL
jgi:hypothetical protein